VQDASVPVTFEQPDELKTADLTSAEASARLAKYGPNSLPTAPSPSVALLFLRQFLSPLIYVLLAATAISIALGDVKDAIFIGVVLLINGIVGTVQEYSAERAAEALKSLEQPHATVVRDGARCEIDARDIVPGDLVLLEAGARVPADMTLVEVEDLRCDESLLTGESLPVTKERSTAQPEGAGGRRGLAFAGTTIIRGRGKGVTIATGSGTELGKIAQEIGKRSLSKPPLLIRMERFSRMIAIAIGLAILALAIVGLLRGMEWRQLFMLSVGLAVSAIPEGLPVAISVALAVGMRRMAKVNVIVRKMAAVESLGSCTMIATDKTGTLTLNALTVTDVTLPDGTDLTFEPGVDVDSCKVVSSHLDEAQARRRATELLLAAALPNEADFVRALEGWQGHGDMVDVALLGAVRKGGIAHERAREDYPLVSRIPYEPDRRYAASLHRHADRVRIFVKGAPETLIAMCDRMDSDGGALPIDRELLLRQKNALAERGLRVLSFASGDISAAPEGGFNHDHLVNLTFLGLAGMQDPVRPEVPAAIHACRSAGIEVAMITGDDPRTAASIALQAGLSFSPDQVVTGEIVRQAQENGDAALDALTQQARIYARVDPAHKLAIVLSLARNGHFVAVTGDGVNDAPALRHAHVGVAMGLRGTDVAKESADIVITDDNFASIVNGVLEGRVAYANIRKVVFMLVSMGAAELTLFLLAIPLGLPAPLTAVQLLWLNLVTNGVQDVALAAEKPEGDELSRPPRRPREPIFDPLMIRRIVLSMVTVGGGGFAVFYWLLASGYSQDDARNLLLLLMVLVENFQTLNSRSERQSVFRQRFASNPFLIVSIAVALGLQVTAMFVPVLRDTLGTGPLGVLDWAVFVLFAGSILVVIEADKWWARALVRRQTRSAAGAATSGHALL
jgi:P-type Ca2+ transporter type 2C